MIEIVKAKTGDLTVRFAGKFLASSYDPRSEGETWAKSVASQVVGLKTVFILGAAAGYHLEALKNTYPHLQVICIDHRAEVSEAVRSRLQISLLGIHVLTVVNAVDVFKNQIVANGLRHGYAVLRGAASRHLDNAFYDQIQDDLNGRSESGFRHLCELRGREDAKAKPTLEAFSYLDFQEASATVDFEKHVAQQIIKGLVL